MIIKDIKKIHALVRVGARICAYDGYPKNPHMKAKWGKVIDIQPCTCKTCFAKNGCNHYIEINGWRHKCFLYGNRDDPIDAIVALDIDDFISEKDMEL